MAGWEVALDKASLAIPDMVDRAPEAALYCTDGYVGYMDVIFPGQHIRNMRDKSDTFTVEGISADLRHYIPILVRRNRYFARNLEILYAVMDVFVYAYNRFGRARYQYRLAHKRGEIPLDLVDFL